MDRLALDKNRAEHQGHLRVSLVKGKVQLGVRLRAPLT